MLRRRVIWLGGLGRVVCGVVWNGEAVKVGHGKVGRVMAVEARHDPVSWGQSRIGGLGTARSDEVWQGEAVKVRPDTFGLGVVR